MKLKIILLTLVSGTAALLIAQQSQTRYDGMAPGNLNAPYLLPNSVVKTQAISPQEISPQNISPTQNISLVQNIAPQNFSTNHLNDSQTNR
jgi:hypothetical protein